jgi:hypothetical protein
MNKNKLFIGGLLCVIILFTGYRTEAQIFSTGIKGGLTSSNLTLQELPTLGMTAGLMGEFKITKWMRLRMEANALWNGTDKHFWEKNDIDFVSVGLPVILEFMPFKNLYLGAGAELDYLIMSTGKSLPANKFNFGLVGHLEYRFFQRLGLGLRYVHNLGNFSNIKDIGESIGNSPISTAFPVSSLQLTLSYSFGK